MRNNIYVSISSKTPTDGIIKAGGKEELLAFDISNRKNEDIILNKISLKDLSNNGNNEINIKNIYCYIDNSEEIRIRSKKENIKNENIILKIDNLIIEKGKTITIYISGDIKNKKNKSIFISLRSIKTNIGIKEDIIIGAFLTTWSKTRYNSTKGYFHILDFIYSKIGKSINKTFLNIYYSLLIIFLIPIIISFIFLNLFYFDLGIINNLINISENIFFIGFTIIVIFLIILKNIINIIKFIFDYIFQIKNIFLVVIFNILFIYSNNLYLNYYNFGNILKILFIIIIIGVFLKYLSLNEWKDYKKGYMFNKLGKIYQMTLENKGITESKWNTFLGILYSFNIEGNTITPISDEPIGLNNIDILKNKGFVKNIYDIMNGINFNEFNKSYSIGIVGEWGGGKSSIINLLDQQFLKSNPNFKVLKFNSWDYKKENLINNFFGELSKILGVRDISNSLKMYLNLIGNIDGTVKIGTKFLSGFIGNKSLEVIKNEINTKLNNYGSKIVVIIDDLDRCEPDEVLLMLNLIKNLGDFNNIIYLVSYDKEHIIQVLDDKKFTGDYIEKIINIERFIPIPGKKELKEYFKEELRKILEKLKISGEKIYTNEKKGQIIRYISEEFDYLFEKENLRFIKKLLNQLNIVLQLNLEKYNSKIEELKKDDFEKIIIINYCKLKNYKLFSEILKINEKLKLNDGYTIKSSDIFKELIYIDINIRNDYFTKLFKNILGLKMKPSEEKNIYNFYYIFIQYKRYILYGGDKLQYFDNEKDFINQKDIYDNINKNITLLNYYS